MRLTVIITLMSTLIPLCSHAGGHVQRSRNGIIVCGEGDSVRAMEPFGGTAENGARYASVINRYADSLAGRVNVYSLVAPTAIAYYCPDTARTWTKDEKAALENIRRNLSPRVKSVDVYTELLKHTAEPIYLRTDHHWAPLAAWYAAECFARAAGVPFAGVEAYDTAHVHNFVGTMYKFSGNVRVKNAPEDFVYYLPKDSSYRATFIKYRLGKNRAVIGENAPEECAFFVHYRDGSPSAYCTFMGGDSRTVSVKTAQHNNRRLLIIKDSYGNALPSCLFASFEEVHVIDFRYFSKSILGYISQNGITDLLFANNIGHAHARSTASAYERLLAKPHEKTTQNQARR